MLWPPNPDAQNIRRFPDAGLILTQFSLTDLILVRGWSDGVPTLVLCYVFSVVIAYKPPALSS